ncbi:hypothetical protein VULLAG_LOCUS515 [Vulpes lagopus]
MKSSQTPADSCVPDPAQSTLDHLCGGKSSHTHQDHVITASLFALCPRMVTDSSRSQLCVSERESLSSAETRKLRKKRRESKWCFIDRTSVHDCHTSRNFNLSNLITIVLVNKAVTLDDNMDDLMAYRLSLDQCLHLV